MEKVLEHWPVTFSLREFIAGALTSRCLPRRLTRLSPAAKAGRGRSTTSAGGYAMSASPQNENQEKLPSPGRYRPVRYRPQRRPCSLRRKKVQVTLRSRHGDFTTAVLPKAGLPDVLTLTA